MDEALHARLLRGGEEVARAVDHHALKLFGASLSDRDEVDDGVGAGERGAQARGVRHVAGRELDALLHERVRAAGVAHERAHVTAVRAQRLHDVPADETGGAGDEDHSKFL